MTTVQPLLEPLLWLRWVAAAAVIVLAPGHVLVGRHLRGTDGLTRLVISLAAGIALCVLLGVLAGWARLPLRPLPYVGLALVTAAVAGRARGWRNAAAALVAEAPRSPLAVRFATAFAVAVSAGLLLAGYGSLPAPPHVFDASNHAFLVQRIAESGRTDARSMFAGLPVAPATAYLPGWHVPAALIARLGGVAPYVSAWFLPLVLTALLPAALGLAWRSWGAPAGACALAALLCTANRLVPGGILEWGGFGQIAGLFLLPVLLASLRGLVVQPAAGTAILAGFFWAALTRIHAAEAAAALLLLLLVWWRRPRASWRRASTAVLGAIALAVLLAGPDAWALSRDYAGTIIVTELAPPERLGYSLEKLLKAGGREPWLVALTSIGLLWALARRGWRAAGLAGLATGAVFLGLASFRDPVTSFLGIPFYREAPRVLYLTVLVLPALAALALLAGRAFLAPRWRRPWPDVALAVAVAAALVPAWPGVVRGHRENAISVPFTREEYALAARLPSLVPPSALVANFWDDGSTWAMHVSGRRFLLPVSWQLFATDGDDMEEVMWGLTERPWPEGARRLEALGAAFVWVSDRRFPSERRPAAGRALFAADSRFLPVSTGGEATLYRIRWDAE